MKNKFNVDISKLIIKDEEVSSIVGNFNECKATISTLKCNETKIECLIEERINVIA